jgi:hypothetical protein
MRSKRDANIRLANPERRDNLGVPAAARYGNIEINHHFEDASRPSVR